MKITRKNREDSKYWLKKTDNLRKNKIYGGCRVYSPSGNLMFLCVEKKANWYLERVDDVTGKPLARKIRHINPVLNFLMKIIGIKPKSTTVQLMFEPKNQGNVGDKYALSKKQNRCVITGSETIESLTKHHITPYCYRKYMPEEYKSANSHDVVPIISEKHYEYEREADKLKNHIAKMYDAPIDGQTKINHKLFYAIKSAHALNGHENTMPQEKSEIYKNRIREYIGQRDITQDVINKLIETDFEDAKKTKTHGEIVVEKLMLEGAESLQNFVEMWREHFIQHANPKYMPKHWSVRRPASRVETKNNLLNIK